MANIENEQLKSDLSLVIKKDTHLKITDINKNIIELLGNNCKEIKVCNKRVISYTNNNITEILITGAITYLGGSGVHSIFKKRLQLSQKFREITEYFKNNSTYNVRFIGVYSYEDNIIFVDFFKNSYIKNKMNSSSAHVYTNDLYQGMKYGLFKKIDRNFNKLTVINKNNFKSYLDNKIKESESPLINIFNKFNSKFNFNTWITAFDAIPEMYNNNWGQWKQGEWPGFYLEYIFSNFIASINQTNYINYIASTNKKSNDLDFDLWFADEQFFGDLKASNINNVIAPGNDQENILKAIKNNGKFWYIIYEHETIKDKDKDFIATEFRNDFIFDNAQWPKYKKWDKHSYYKKMKHSVKFKHMFIIEINEINYKAILSNFNQGSQPDGSPRKPKFNINKKNIDNFIIYNYIPNKE